MPKEKSQATIKVNFHGEDKEMTWNDIFTLATILVLQATTGLKLDLSSLVEKVQARVGKAINKPMFSIKKLFYYSLLRKLERHGRIKLHYAPEDTEKKEILEVELLS